MSGVLVHPREASMRDLQPAREATPTPVARGGRIADCDADRGFEDGRELMLAGLSAKTCAADCRARWNS